MKSNMKCDVNENVRMAAKYCDGLMSFIIYMKPSNLYSSKGISAVPS